MALKIPFLRPNPPRLSEMLERVEQLEDSGTYTNYGPINSRFEHALEAEMFGQSDTVLTTCNATIALMLTIKDAVVAHNRQRSRYALMPAFTFAAAAQAAEWVRLTPLLCDIEPQGWTACARSEQRLIEQYHDQIAVIVPYATFGNCIDIERYDWISNRYGIPVVIDAAASMGSLDSNGKPFGAGSRHPVIFSMHATKAFSVGEGGIIHCAEQATIKRLREMGNFGFSEPRRATMAGLNSKLTELAAMMALEQLRRHEDVVAHRQALAARYRANLPDWTFQQTYGQRQAHSLMPVLPPASFKGTRAELMDELARNGIGSGAYFSPHLGEHPHLAGRAICDDLTVTNDISRRLLALPLWEGMTDEMVDTVCATLDGFRRSAEAAASSPRDRIVSEIVLDRPAAVSDLSLLDQGPLAHSSQFLSLGDRAVAP
jgi:dTDP-4-amino-4,6-dideoxygalactose transaminase